MDTIPVGNTPPATWYGGCCCGWGKECNELRALHEHGQKMHVRPRVQEKFLLFCKVMQVKKAMHQPMWEAHSTPGEAGACLGVYRGAL